MPINPANDEFYGDAAQQAPPSDMPTAILPRSIVMGKELNVGDQLVLQVRAIHEDEIEVEYPEQTEEPAAPPMTEVPDEMGRMMM